MLIEQERVELIKTFLAGIMDQTEADYFSDYERTIAYLKQGNVNWQLADAIGIYAVVLCKQGQTDDEKMALRELFDTSIEPLDSLIGSLTSGVTSEAYNNKAQLLRVISLKNQQNHPDWHSSLKEQQTLSIFSKNFSKKSFYFVPERLFNG